MNLRYVYLLVSVFALLCGGCESSNDSVPGEDCVFFDDALDSSSGLDAASSVCGGVVCGVNSSCDPASGSCVCSEGYEPLGAHCVLAAPSDVADIYEEEDIVDVARADSGAVDVLSVDGAIDEDLVTLPACAVPQALVLPFVHEGLALAFSVDGDGVIEIGQASDPDALAPDAWQATDTLVLDELGVVKVFARSDVDGCSPAVFSALYEVRESFPPAAGLEGSTAVDMDDPAILGWATGVEDVQFGEAVDTEWQETEPALGPAVGTSTDIVCVGRGGEITLSFEPPIANGPGWDFAVFENGFSDTFLELAFVEVSSDGETFLRFDSVTLNDSPVGGFGALEPDLLEGLGGKYRQGFGTPFDLKSLANRPEVREGAVNLSAITQVRIVDIVGDGSVVDSFGLPIWDPYPTSGSAGFDLDAIAVLNH